MKKNIFLLLSTLFLTSAIYAQVSISLPETPEPAAILQVKEYNPSVSGGETASKGGILLPRVKLNSESDITVIASDAGEDKKLALTGLVVYNVDTTKMDKGLYVWDGKEWNQLEILSEKEGSFTTKSVAKGPLSDNNLPGVEAKNLSFRFSADKKPQCRFNVQPATDMSLYYHIGRFWDYNGPGTVSERPPKVGYTYDVAKITITKKNYSQWHDLHDTPLGTGGIRYEVWIADPLTDQAYHVQFVTYAPSKTQVFVVLITNY
ncbi:MAG: hypothetical protein LBC48_07980 [Dysgonamonadaceae bacterium]|jgi:hypothetical protein|nr:hypothetical protein [Dysgonamonadaceae bacterium]